MSFPGAPVPLSPKERELLTAHLGEQLSDALERNADKEQEFNDNQNLYLAEPRQKQKTFPWKGAANLVIPLIGITTDSIVARIVNTIFATDPFWTIRPLHPDFVRVAKPTEDFLDWSRKVEFNLYRPVKTACIETVQHGTSWIKTPWDMGTHNTYEPTQSGSFQQVQMKRSRPLPMHVLDVDVLRQGGVMDESQAEWICHRIRLTDTQLWERKVSGMYEGVDDDLLSKKEDVCIQDDVFETYTNSSYAKPAVNTIYEFTCRMRIPGYRNQDIHDFVVTYHHAAKKILRAIFNPIAWGERILTKMRFVEVVGKSCGLGIARQLRHMQDEISTIHCQQVDNATIANTRFFVGRRGRIKDGTRIWPGRFLTTPDPEKDIKTLQLGDIYQSMRALEQSVLAFAERRSGVSDYALGRESSVMGSRATATGTLAIIQEGNRRFDLNVRDMRDSLGDVGRLILQLNQQFRPQGIAYFVQGEEGMLTEMTLNLPQEYVANKLGVELTASTATINKQVEQQGMIALLGTLMQHFQTGQQAAMMLASPQVPAEVKEFTAKAMNGISEVVRRITHTFDQKDQDSLVPMALAEGMMDAQGQTFNQSATGMPGGAAANGSMVPNGGIPPGPAGNSLAGNA